MEKPQVKVCLKSRAYDVFIQKNILSSLENFCSLENYSFVFIISNETVFPLYGKFLENFCQKQSKPYQVYQLSDGERYKSWDCSKKILDAMILAGLDRKSLVMALGGGVVGDMAGFVATIYMRGIDFLNIPTTLLACVDSSIGGKVGVNHPMMKNAFGFFSQPSMVLIDSDILKTLPEREYVSGLAEVIKYAIIWPSELFEFLKKNRIKILERQDGCLEKMIQLCCQIKAWVVEKDEKESDLRAILNFGHTLGHAIESATNYCQYFHGEAIAIGMVFAVYLAVRLKWLKDSVRVQMIELINSYGLPIWDKTLSWNKIRASLKRDKKFTFGHIQFVLPKKIGEVSFCKEVTWENLERLYEELSKKRDGIFT